MSKHYCCKHPARGRSKYPARLEARGLSKAPRMESLEALRRRQLDGNGDLLAKYR